MKLGAETYSYSDFTQPGQSAVFIAADGIQGAGSDRTIIDLRSVDKTNFPVWKTGDTTPFDVIRAQPPKLVLPGMMAPKFVGFSLIVDPAAQKGLYNGLRLAYATNPLIEDVRVVGVPGTGNQPPWETFGIDLTHCQGALLRDVVIDGQDMSGAGIGLNNCFGTLLDRCESHHGGCSHGFTAWNCLGVTYLDCVSRDNGFGIAGKGGVGFNSEETSNTVHVQSRSYNNSMADFRYLSSKGSTANHRIIGAYPLLPKIVFAGSQSADDVKIG